MIRPMIPVSITRIIHTTALSMPWPAGNLARGPNGYRESHGLARNGRVRRTLSKKICGTQPVKMSRSHPEDGKVRVDPNGDAIPNNEVCALLSPLD
jgi:hypothetical protein